MAGVLGLSARGRRRLRLGASAGAVLALTGWLAVVDPHEAGRLPPLCPLHALTGLDCPGCGGVRVAHDLLHRDLVAAAHDNVVLLALLPLLLAGWVWRLAARPGRAGPVPAWQGYALAGLAVVWGVVRNLPGWPLQPLTR